EKTRRSFFCWTLMPATRPDYLPAADESCVVSNPAMWKRDALLFDRIFVSRDTPPDPEIIPDNIDFGSVDTDREVAERKGKTRYFFTMGFANGWTPESFEDETEPVLTEEGRIAVLEYYGRMGTIVIPAYRQHSTFVRDFPNGKRIAYEAVLLNLPLVDPSSTTWEQVLDFRNDARARGTYRDLRLWLESGLQASSVQSAGDVINQKVSDYEWALKKHGFQTKLGAFTSVLDLKTSLATSTAAAVGFSIGGPIWAAIASGTLFAGQVLANVLEKRIEVGDIYRSSHREIAMIYDANKKFSNFLREGKGIYPSLP